MRFGVVFGVLAAVCMPVAAWGDDDVGGFTNRIEKEYKLDVPPQQLERVWEYLKTRYAEPDKAGFDFAGHAATRLGDEYFVDIYFDDAKHSLKDDDNGVRHRTRYIFTDSTNEKHGRQLLQVKLTPAHGAVTRTEVKFDVKPVDKPVTAEDKHPLFGLIDPKDRQRLRDTIREAGVNADGLRPAVEIKQRRRRVYLNVNDAPFVTITLDEVSSSKWLREVSFVEIEMELNEIAYTEANTAERARMSKTLDAMRADVMNKFPGIRQDQTPKYSKVFHRMEQKFWLFGTMLNYGFPLEGLLGLGLVGAGALGVSRKRRRDDGGKRA